MEEQTDRSNEVFSELVKLLRGKGNPYGYEWNFVNGSEWYLNLIDEQLKIEFLMFGGDFENPKPFLEFRLGKYLPLRGFNSPIEIGFFGYDADEACEVLESKPKFQIRYPYCSEGEEELMKNAKALVRDFSGCSSDLLGQLSQFSGMRPEIRGELKKLILRVADFKEDEACYRVSDSY
jgi:hypothetical protein